jgi:hypothetical protein
MRAAVAVARDEPVWREFRPGRGEQDEPNMLHAALARLDVLLAGSAAADAADEIRDKATLAAIEALTAGGTSVDTAAVVIAVNAVRDEARMRFAELAAAAADERAARIVAEQNAERLSAAIAKAGAAVAEVADVVPAPPV